MDDGDARQGGFGFDALSAALGPVEQWPVGRLFAAAAQRSGAAYAKLVDEAGTGTSTSGFLLLRLLMGRDGQRPGELARQLMVTPATVTTVADTLERNGHVERRRDTDDRRVVRLHITPQGVDLVDRTAARMLPHLRELYGFVAPDDEPVIRRFLLGLIERYNALLAHDGLPEPSAGPAEATARPGQQSVERLAERPAAPAAGVSGVSPEAADTILDDLLPDEIPDDLLTPLTRPTTDASSEGERA
ncbi:MarR family winged helix-turn-helix transcriptional regulator [Spirillospora sp. NPDC127200]